MVLFIILGFVILTFILATIVFFKQSQKSAFRPEEMAYINSHWIRIIDSFNSEPRYAVLDADKLLDYALSRKGFVGNVGDKLKKAKYRFSDLDGVWRAHKLRNRIAHELGTIDKEEARSALKHFKRALNDLGAEL